jgi:hypothetical protein
VAAESNVGARLFPTRVMPAPKGPGASRNVGWAYADDPLKIMTILGAVKTDDGIWIAADSRHVGTFPPNQPSADAWATTVEKLRPLGDRLVWGWYGDGGLKALELEAFMETVTPPSWPELEELVLHKMLDLKTPAFGVLIAGYIGTEGRIVHKGDDMLNTLGSTDDAIFCGYCKMAALTAWTAASAVAPDSDTERRFDAVMEAVIQTSNNVLGEPRVLWRLTPTERTQVRSTQPNSGTGSPNS